VVIEIKFCGLTRPDDGRFASELGAQYAGAIFAGGPRHVEPAHAAAVFAAAGDAVRRVGVFSGADPDAISAAADVAGLDIVQLHGDPSPEDVRRVRTASGREIWAVLRVSGSTLPAEAESLFAVADAVLLDARVEGRLGGTGIALPWAALAASLERARGNARIVLAGGLTPLNVRDAIEALRPDVVDVSSGVESAPGCKDHVLMRAFAGAVRA
jgi:phosphoribosylanthranilate isomerase